ncbi:MAG: hypothetical protein C0597_03110 [Marinilabiliales bacterium]|nr:MAG: hypothetical protein C0597_03110 [Marinilabiliales bacterium]
MKTQMNLADYNHPLVKETAYNLTKGAKTDRQKIENLFYYVRDEIKFGFVTEVDYMSASDIINKKLGACNNKGVLLFALCKSIDIPVRMHFSLINKEIQRGLFKGIAYKLLPSKLSHGWVEVFIEDKWRNIDSYINDETYYQAARKELKNRNWDTGFSVACSSGESSSAFDIDEEKFVQMDAVAEDQGVWNDPSDYLFSELYHNKVNFVKELIIKYIIFPKINKRVSDLRNSYMNGLC